MGQAERRSVIAALSLLAASHDYRDRADAGRALASFAEATESRQTLLRLVLDGRDTFVTYATVDALLRRDDSAGLAVVATALATADANQADWIHAAVGDVFGIYAGKRDEAVGMCEAVIEGSDEPLRGGAIQLRDKLTAINPVLYPLTED